MEDVQGVKTSSSEVWKQAEEELEGGPKAKTMEETPATQRDARSQPWKEWIKEELEARKKADTTEEGRRAQEERIKAYEAASGDNELDGCGQNGNKAG